MAKLCCTVILAVLGCLVSCYQQDCGKHVTIQAIGNWPVTDGDVALVLYANIANGKKVTAYIKMKSWKCCLVIAGGKDCESMKLIGDHQVDLKPTELKQFIYVYPTVYPYDREGECEVHLAVKTSRVCHLRLNIPFKTHIKKDPWIDWVPQFIQTVLFGAGVRDCPGVDEDRLRRCIPVNCQLKYSGAKNFYNSTSGRCVTVQTCVSDTQIYDPVKNYCRETRLDLRKLSNLGQRTSVPDGQHWRELVGPRLDCSHGHLSTDQLDCVCDPHWTTADTMTTGQGTDTEQAPVKQMCNVQQGVAKATVLYVIVLFVLLTLLVLAGLTVGLCVRARVLGRQYYHNSEPFQHKKTSCFDKLHKLWKPTSDSGEVLTAADF